MNVQPSSRSTRCITDDANSTCSVSVRCSTPTEDGEMSVECTYEGDALLAAYLLQRALSYLEGQIESDMPPLS